MNTHLTFVLWPMGIYEIMYYGVFLGDHVVVPSW